LSGNRHFHRSFIIMKEWNTGYGLFEGKEPAGYCKMEIKNKRGKLQLYIQDMKPAESEQNIYDVVLVSNKEEVYPIKLTSIQIPEGGRGEYEIDFEPDDVRQSGFDIGQYHALAVVDRPLKLDKALRFPLVGYSDKRVELNWSDDVSSQLLGMYGETRPSKEDISNSEQNKVEEAKHILQDLDEPIEEQEFLQEQVDNSGTEQENSYDIEREEEEDQDMSIEALEDQPIEGQHMENQEDISELDSSQEIAEANLKSLDEENQSTYWSQVESYYNNLFDRHKKVTPFDDAVAEVDWIRVDNQNEWSYPTYSSYMPQQGYAVYNPYRNDESRLDHYLVGLVRNLGKVEYVVYAIPGIYSSVPPMSMHGFSRWLPVKNGYGAGYWLLYIDVKTGNIAYPY
jgi:hypothetical protein